MTYASTPIVSDPTCNYIEYTRNFSDRIEYVCECECRGMTETVTYKTPKEILENSSKSAFARTLEKIEKYNPISVFAMPVVEGLFYILQRIVVSSPETLNNMTPDEQSRLSAYAVNGQRYFELERLSADVLNNLAPNEQARVEARKINDMTPMEQGRLSITFLKNLPLHEQVCLSDNLRCKLYGTYKVLAKQSWDRSNAQEKLALTKHERELFEFARAMEEILGIAASNDSFLNGLSPAAQALIESNERNGLHRFALPHLLSDT